jgi:glycosyltransferase involved in cell wall biosynthesis
MSTSDAGPGFRTLILGGAAFERPAAPELRRLVAEDLWPDYVWARLPQVLEATVVDSSYLAQLSGVRGRLLRRLPYTVAQCLEAFLQRGRYDTVLTWGERLAVAVAALMHFARNRPAHVAFLFWISPWKKALPLRLVHRGIDRMIMPSPLQRRFALARLGLSPEKVVEVPWAVDTRFWRPMPDGDRECICSAGSEMRDYETLVAALRPLRIRCHIAAGTLKGTRAQRRTKINMRALPDWITTGRKSFVELRRLYANSRFVVVPLLPSDSDNGITTSLEAMAMGKAIICTDTEGQIGVLRNGVNSIRVPPCDEAALRAAIQRLWADPELCARLGAAGRRLIEARHGLDEVVPQIVAALRDAATQRRSRET